MLPSVLQRAAALPVRAAEDGLVLRPGQVVVGVPDRHLLVADGRVVLGRGARENNHRPSHDAMLRAAALSHGPRAVGVVLTGMLDDGSAGLRCLARYGGACLVQDPDDALYPDMPRHALEAVPTARAVPLDQLAEEVVRVVGQTPQDVPPVPQEQRALDAAEVEAARGHPGRLPDGSIPGTPTALACPDCHGVLHALPDGSEVRFRCRTGHAWTSEALLAKQDTAVEEALWTALRALEERADLSARMADHSRSGGRSWSLAAYAHRSEESRRAAETLRALLLTGGPAPEDVPGEPA